MSTASLEEATPLLDDEENSGNSELFINEEEEENDGDALARLIGDERNKSSSGCQQWARKHSANTRLYIFVNTVVLLLSLALLVYALFTEIPVRERDWYLWYDLSTDLLWGWEILLSWFVSDKEWLKRKAHMVEMLLCVFSVASTVSTLIRWELATVGMTDEVVGIVLNICMYAYAIKRLLFSGGL